MKQKRVIVIACSIIMAAITIVSARSFFVADGSERYASMREFIESQYDSVREAGMGDYFQYDYPELMEEAQVVAVVKSVDDLTVENSFGVSEKGDVLFAAFSLREVEVIESLKGNVTPGESIEVAEKCVLLENGMMVASESCYPMRKGDYYLLFLSPSGYSGSPLLPISADNGKCDLTNLYLNPDGRKALFIEACSDLLLKETEPLKLDRMFQDEIAEKQITEEENWESRMFTTPYTDKENGIEISWKAENGETIYRIGNSYFREATNQADTELLISPEPYQENQEAWTPLLEYMPEGE